MEHATDPEDTPQGSREAGRQDRLALIEVFERDGRVARCVSVQRWPLTLGRALDNDVVLDDPHVAAHHATLQADDQSQLTLIVGDSINGVNVGSDRFAAGARVALPVTGAAMQIGAIKLRLRLPGETLAPERALLALNRAHLLPPLLAGVLVMLLALADHWVVLDPGADATAWLPIAVGVPLALAGWCGAWALVSKLFQHRFDFMGHLRIVLPWLLVIELVDVLLPAAGAALAWPWLWRLAMPLQALLAVLMLRAHLTQVLPLSGRIVTAVVASAALVGTAIALTLTQRTTDRYSRPAYMSTLPLSALHRAVSTPTAALVQDMAPLASKLANRVQKARADEDSEGDPGGD